MESLQFKRSSFARATVRMILAFILTIASALPLEAATFTVTNSNDAGEGSLRKAILDANAAAGADIITFDAGLTGTITLLTALPTISQSLTITGSGADVLTVSGNNAVRVFNILTD